MYEHTLEQHSKLAVACGRNQHERFEHIVARLPLIFHMYSRVYGPNAHTLGEAHVF